MKLKQYISWAHWHGKITRLFPFRFLDVFLLKKSHSLAPSPHVTCPFSFTLRAPQQRLRSNKKELMMVEQKKKVEENEAIKNEQQHDKSRGPNETLDGLWHKLNDCQTHSISALFVHSAVHNLSKSSVEIIQRALMRCSPEMRGISISFHVFTMKIERLKGWKSILICLPSTNLNLTWIIFRDSFNVRYKNRWWENDLNHPNCLWFSCPGFPKASWLSLSPRCTYKQFKIK